MRLDPFRCNRQHPSDSGWVASARPRFTTLSPDRETVLSFDLEGRPISWFEAGRTYKRSLASVVHGRERVGGQRRRFVVGDTEAAGLFARLLDRVREAPRERLPEDARGRIDGILRWTPETLLAERERFEAAYAPVSILPPDQYLAIVVQATHGCTWNRCTFCNFYQDRRFEVRSAEVLADHLARVADLLGDAAAIRRRLFLADGNALALSIDRLRPIVDTARAVFPGRPWSGFVDVFTGERKTVDDWRALRDHGLDRVYVGLETGHGPLLTFLNKPGTPDEAGSFLTVLKEAGVRVTVILMAGAGGERYAEGHVRDTLALVGGLPLGPGDLVYLSPFVEHAGSEYVRRARSEGVGALADEDREAQAIELRDRLRAALPGVQVARYDIREFVY